VCVCTLRYLACNAHAPYCRLWLAGLYHIFTLYLINRTIFEKRKLFERKCVLLFSLQIVSEIFLTLRKTERYGQKCVLVFMQSIRKFCQIFKKIEFCLQILEEKYSNMKFYEIPSSESRVFPCGSTDRWTDRET